MRLYIHNSRALLSGLIFTGVGALALYCGRNYRIGTATQMGPGYFPFALALLLTGLGVASMAMALRLRPAAAVSAGRAPAQPLGRWHVTPLFFVIAGVVVFGLLVDRAGLVPAIAGLLALGCYQRILVRPLETVVVAAVLIVVAVALFIYGLGMPFTMLAWD